MDKNELYPIQTFILSMFKFNLIEMQLSFMFSFPCQEKRSISALEKEIATFEKDLDTFEVVIAVIFSETCFYFP